MNYKKDIEPSILKELKEKSKPAISVHPDADGLSSGSLLASAIGKSFQEIDFLFPSQFGQTEFDILRGAEEKSLEPDVILDQAPLSPDYKGLVVDHHQGHEDSHEYDLVWSPHYCTARILYNSLEEEIPVSEQWKTSLGIAGDGGEDEVPTEIFIKAPELLAQTGYTYGRKYGSEIDYSPQFAFVMAKSLLNYGTRIGDYDMALNKLMNAGSVTDIIHDDQLLGAKKTVKGEIKNIYGSNDQAKIEVYQYLAFIEYKSDYRLWIGNDLFSRTNKTSIALNTKDHSFSIRGPLAQRIAEMLDQIEGIDAGGHLSYAGGSLFGKSDDFLRQQVPILDQEWKKID